MVSSNLISRFLPHRQNNRSKSVVKQAIHSTNTPFEISTKQQYPGKTVEMALGGNMAPGKRAFADYNYRLLADFDYVMMNDFDYVQSVDDHPVPLCGFSSPFLESSPHLYDHCDVRLGSSYDLV
ncbi:hypothetical protein TNCV_2450781 [Trichonephila clavipes]|nr:hypothetical protein TNCV_2450781 [Trichonephila clavipes]